MTQQPQPGTVYRANDGKWYRWPTPVPFETREEAEASAPQPPAQPTQPTQPTPTAPVHVAVHAAPVVQHAGGAVGGFSQAPRGGRFFAFTGGASTYIGTALLGVLITVFTIGICYPFALVLRERWRCKHAYINGQQLRFTGSAWGLFGNWLKWLLLSFVTAGIYLLWVGPRIARWKWENTTFATPTSVQPAR